MATRNVTLLQLRTDIQFQVDQAIGSSGHTQTTNVNRLINQSIQRFRERVSSEGMTRYLVSTTGTLTAGATSPYPFLSLDLSSASPAVVRTYGVDVTVNGNVVKTLSHVPFTERANYGGPSVTGEPMAWSHFQSTKLAITPAPNQPYPYVIWYLPVQADLSADGDTFDGVAGWEDYIVWDVVARLIVRDQYVEAYQAVVQLRDEIWRDIVRGAQRVTSAGGAVVGRDAFGSRVPGMRGALGQVAGSGGGGGLTAVGNQGNLQYNNNNNLAGAQGISTDGFSLEFLTGPSSTPPSNQYISVPTGGMFAFGFSGVDGLRISANASIPSNILFQALNNSGRGQPMEFLSVDRGSVASGLDVYLGAPAATRDVNIRAARNINLTPAANITANASTSISLTAPVVTITGAVAASGNGVFGNVNVNPGGRLGISTLGFPTGFGDKLASWTPSGYANQATGIHVVASGTALGFGASPSTGGTLRLSNGQSIQTRKADGSANITIASVQSDNVVQIGDATNGQELDLNSSTFVDMNYPGTANPQFRWSTAGQFMGSGTSISWGTNSAVGGIIRIPNGTDIRARNAGGTTDLLLARTDATDNNIYGNDTGGNNLLLSAASGKLIGLRYAGGANTYEFSSSAADFKQAALLMGSGPASGGKIRLSNTDQISWRNTAGSANIAGLQVLNGDILVLGDSAAINNGITVQVGNTQNFDLKIDNNFKYRFGNTAANFFDNALISVAGLTMSSGTNIKLPGNAGYIGFASGAGQASTGFLRFGANAGNLLEAKSYDAVTNLQLFNLSGDTTFTDLRVGDSSNAGINSLYLNAKAQVVNLFNGNIQAQIFQPGSMTMASGVYFNSNSDLIYNAAAASKHVFKFGLATGLGFTPSGIDLNGRGVYNGYLVGSGFGGDASQVALIPTGGLIRVGTDNNGFASPNIIRAADGNNYNFPILDWGTPTGYQPISNTGRHILLGDPKIGQVSARKTGLQLMGDSVYLRSTANGGVGAITFDVTNTSGPQWKFSASGINQLVMDQAGTFAFVNGPTGYALSGVGTISGSDGYTKIVDWVEPLRGGLLTDANVTKTVGLGSRYIMPSGILSTGRTVTLIPTGAIVGEILHFERLDTSANTLAIANGGPGGSGTIYTFPASQKRAADFIFASATSWTLAGHVRLS